MVAVWGPESHCEFSIQYSFINLPTLSACMPSSLIICTIEWIHLAQYLKHPGVKLSVTVWTKRSGRHCCPHHCPNELIVSQQIYHRRYNLMCFVAGRYIKCAFFSCSLMLSAHQFSSLTLKCGLYMKPLCITVNTDCSPIPRLFNGLGMRLHRLKNMQHKK